MDSQSALELKLVEYQSGWKKLPLLGVAGMLISLAIELLRECVGKFGSLVEFEFGSEASSYIFRIPSNRTYF